MAHSDNNGRGFERSGSVGGERVRGQLFRVARRSAKAPNARQAIAESLSAYDDTLSAREIAFANSRSDSPDCQSVSEAFLV